MLAARLGAQMLADRALATLARRYLAGHGPAADRDLAKWAGIPQAGARTGLKAIASELEERHGDIVDLAGWQPPAELPPPRLLGSFEPVLMGWTSRELLLAGNDRKVGGGGLFRPIALVQGRAVATWGLISGRVVLEPFERLIPSVARALEVEGKDVVRFLG
jgi:hypothetical protein